MTGPWRILQMFKCLATSPQLQFIDVFRSMTLYERAYCWFIISIGKKKINKPTKKLAIRCLAAGVTDLGGCQGRFLTGILKPR